VRTDPQMKRVEITAAASLGERGSPKVPFWNHRDPTYPHPGARAHQNTSESLRSTAHAGLHDWGPPPWRATQVAAGSSAGAQRTLYRSIGLQKLFALYGVGFALLRTYQLPALENLNGVLAFPAASINTSRVVTSVQAPPERR